MGKKKKKDRLPEIRADTQPVVDPVIEPEVGTVLLRALFGGDDFERISREDALQIPTVQACIALISSTISRLPLQLRRTKRNGTIEIIKNDARVNLLNADTGDTLTATQFWKAMLEDYFLGKGGFAYINRRLNAVKSIHYVEDTSISIGYQSFDPIFKEYDILVQGARYRPGDFLKILRKTKDGMRSSSIVDENQLELAVAFAELKFELMTVKKGGMKSGFLQTDQVVSQKVADELKKQIPKLYTDPKTNVVFLNNGIKFQEANATTQELQLNENKSSNAEEICKLFGIPASMICGSRTGNSMTEEDEKQFIRACVAVMTDIECSLNRDLLLESEKKTYSWKFDTKELTRGSIGERYEAYKIGLEKNFLQIDEVREKEDMEPLGIDWVQMNLNTVFYNPKTKEIYTPNTNASMNLESGKGAVVKPEAEPEQKGGEPENEGGTES